MVVIVQLTLLEERVAGLAQLACHSVASGHESRGWVFLLDVPELRRVGTMHWVVVGVVLQLPWEHALMWVGEGSQLLLGWAGQDCSCC